MELAASAAEAAAKLLQIAVRPIPRSPDWGTFFGRALRFAATVVLECARFAALRRKIPGGWKGGQPSE